MQFASTSSDMSYVVLLLKKLTVILKIPFRMCAYRIVQVLIKIGSIAFSATVKSVSVPQLLGTSSLLYRVAIINFFITMDCHNY